MLPLLVMNAPLNYLFRANGPAAKPVLHLDWVFSSISVAVSLIVGILLVWALLRSRPSAPDVMHDDGGLSWIYIGTTLSVFALFGMTLYMLVTLNNIATPPHAPDLSITVTARQWWWQADYDAANPAERFSTANEIHIPVGKPVQIILKSTDVIHTFWVPALSGKTQAIPGLTNRQWIEADEPGTYRGQCTEYCGVQHAHMALDVVAEMPRDFEAWRQKQIQPVAANASPGGRIFMSQCAACHALRGTAAAGGYGPDLTHLQSRREIAAGLMTNTPDHLSDWISRPQELKSGARMPDFDFTASDKAALVSYLATLQ
jgi:cytochrome c oxidase subunit II